MRARWKRCGEEVGRGFQVNLVKGQREGHGEEKKFCLEVECWEEKEGIKERFYKEQKEKNDEDMEEKVVKEEEVKKLG